MINLRSIGIVLCILFLELNAWAGESLTPQELVKRSEAIAYVEVNLRSNQVKVLEWLMTTHPAIGSKNEPKQIEDLSNSHCLPNQKGIQRWLHRFSRSKSRKDSQKLWKQSLAAGHYRSLVFLKWNATKNSLVATCETEVMEVQQWSIHPHFDQFKTLIQTLIRNRKSIQK